MSDVPFFAISNEELAAAPPLGKTITCPRCGAEHDVTSSESASVSLQFYRCGDSTYLAGVDGKSVAGPVSEDE